MLTNKQDAEKKENSTTLTPGIAWFSLHAGQICLGKKPVESDFERLKSLGVTHIATVQTSEEHAPVIRDNSVAAGLEWLWVPFVHPSSESPTEDTHLHQYLHEHSYIDNHCNSQA